MNVEEWMIMQRNSEGERRSNSENILELLINI